MSTTTVSTGGRRLLTLPHSEVCMYMGIAGRTMAGELVGEHAVQLFDDAGRAFSSPITIGEAGWGMVGFDHTLTVFVGGLWYSADTLVIPAIDAQPNDVIAGTAGGPANTISAADSIGGKLAILDFADGTSTAPFVNGFIQVQRRRAA